MKWQWEGEKNELDLYERIIYYASGFVKYYNFVDFMARGWTIFLYNLSALIRFQRLFLLWEDPPQVLSHTTLQKLFIFVESEQINFQGKADEVQIPHDNSISDWIKLINEQEKVVNNFVAF